MTKNTSATAALAKYTFPVEYSRRERRFFAVTAVKNGEERKGLTLDELADRILGLLQEHYFATPDHPSEPYDYLLASEDKWQQRGDPAEYAIGDMTGLPDEIAANVTAVLSLQEAAAGFIRSSRPNCGAGDRAGRGAGVSIESRGWDGPCQGGRTYGS